MYNPTYFDRYHIREGLLQVSSRQLVIGTWNVEGLTEEKKKPCGYICEK